MIDYDVDAPADKVYERPGYRQVTPADRYNDRHYEYTGLDAADVLAPEPKVTWWKAHPDWFLSMTAVLGRGIVTDWTGPAKYNTADGVLDNLDRIATLERDVARKEIVTYADASLDLAANRGTAGHRAVEALTGGQAVDYRHLEKHGANPWLLAVRRFLEVEQPVIAHREVACFIPELRIAGTVDVLDARLPNRPELGSHLVMDYKFRAKSHDRRQKDAAQVAGYALAASEHFFLDEKGGRRSCEIDGAAVVTFCPDSTYAIHPVRL